MAVRSDMYVSSIYEETLSSIGVSTHTQTTSTLTPTTLKNIEESLYEYSGGIPSAPQQHEHQAGFMPPVVNVSHFGNSSATIERLTATSGEDSMIDTDDSLNSKTYWNENADQHTTSDDLSVHQSSISVPNGIKRESKTRSTSGRRPKNNEKLTPEEEERRKVRRERNKQAAARCRKRRLDHTNNLIKETQGLEEKKSALQNEYQMLKSQKEELLFILNSHKSDCKRISVSVLSDSDRILNQL